jgi:peptide/nickel transport system substrate-binding protein
MRRILRRRQHQVEAATTLAEAQFDDNFTARLERLLDVQRFIVGWIFLLTLIIVLTALQAVGLNRFYLTTGPVTGGVYDEGMIGTYSNASPLYATGAVDLSVSRLLFSGLLKYDDNNQLVGDLASAYTVDNSGKVYTVQLKHGLKWHDGKSLTAKDVAFTYQLIQNPDVQSPLFSSWLGIGVKQLDEYTLQFTLPGALTAFPYSMTNGIVPYHVLAEVPFGQLRSNSFNTTRPVGAGPFEWSALQLGSSVDPDGATALIALKPFADYNGGKPKLASYILHTYDSEEQLLAAYQKRKVVAASGLRSIPENIRKDQMTHVYTFNMTAENMVFFKTSKGILNDSAIRKALVLATDRSKILQLLDYSVVPANGPLLIGQLGYDKEHRQIGYDLAVANSVLDGAGWTKGSDGVRRKDGQVLGFQLLTENTTDARTVSKYLQSTWRSLGVNIQLLPQQAADFQSSVDRHDYTALLYSISVGVDPDVFVYWDSSQSDIRSSSRLNLSEYSSATADTALEAGRTRQDPVVRIVKYHSFLQAWQQDNPAIALYQPNSIYITRGTVTGLTEHALNVDADRYYSIHNWEIKTGRIPK